MKLRTIFIAVCLLACAAFSLQAAPKTSATLPFDNIAGSAGVIRITPVFHGTVQIEYRGKVVIVDPVSAGSYNKKADLILITHAHPDHFDKDAIMSLCKVTTQILVPDGIDNRNVDGGLSGGVTKLYGDTKSMVFNRIPIREVPMYNLVRGPNAGQKFHSKGEGNGYILTIGGKRIYIAGDTEVTPEMKRLKNIDMAFLPMNLPFTMTPQEAASAAKAFRPRIVYPYHYRYPFDKANTNPQQFAAALKGTGIQVRLRN
jgi:L-ascorbate metabolism protein UlaG (beta-lactamase superfamily)